ncbi:hypothetical protein [Cellvibrio sp. PSBB023]|uniref:hypothetical protein n=1 Tax=Cellvibrio sp. PSBB023 TaxID=1945512 RepID=UPI00098EC6CE|nr:hypothetical protein [Cellvibrio sp. PSBB023]AQT61909.1 hypothetical protein B0D95_18705 [Cellvibrio sp. PSBB023]
MTANELPDIPGLTAEDDGRVDSGLKQKTNINRNGFSGVALFVTGLICIVVATIAGIFIPIITKDTLMVRLGAAPEVTLELKMNAALVEQKMVIEELNQRLSKLDEALSNLTESSNAASFEVGKVSQRVTTIERFTSELENRIAEHRKKQQAEMVQQQKKVAAAKPKPAPIIPLVLVSIRAQAGTSLVALRDGLDRSDLLMPGDSWRGWTLIDADVAAKKARFQVAGKIQELTL